MVVLWRRAAGVAADGNPLLSQGRSVVSRRPGADAGRGQLLRQIVADMPRWLRRDAGRCSDA